MRQRLTDQRGTTLIEVLSAMMISTIVFAVTLTVFESMTRQQRIVEDQAAAQDEARNAMDRIAREMRNLASPGADLTATDSTLPRSVDRNLPYDLVFKSVRDTEVGPTNDANVQRVRYCLSTVDSPSSARVWRMEQAVAADPWPTDTACPGTGWENPTVVANTVVNRAAGQNRPLFAYAGDQGAITETDSTSRANISRVQMSLAVDPTPNARPLETTLASSVFLRNQNREPTARFTVVVTNLSTRTVRLNGSQSEDPESQSLTYEWYDDSTYIGDGVVRDYTAPTSGNHVFKLRVKDPAGLASSSSAEPIAFP